MASAREVGSGVESRRKYSVFGTAPSGHAFGSSEIHIRWVSIRRRKVLGGLGSACMLSARSVMTRDIGDKCVATS
jgi:hypothetical protein